MINVFFSKIYTKAILIIMFSLLNIIPVFAFDDQNFTYSMYKTEISEKNKANEIFNFLELAFPALLYPLPQNTKIVNEIIYRYYPGEMIYLCTLEQSLYLIQEKNSSGVWYNLGNVDHWFEIAKGQPVILEHPANQVISDSLSFLPESAVFTVEVRGNEPIHYQWQVSRDYGESWEDIPNATGKNYTIYRFGKNAEHGFLFRCKVSSDFITITSNVAVLEVTAWSPPVIYLHPQDKTIQIIQSGPTPYVEFSVHAQGSRPLSYQWQVSNDNGNSWYDIFNANKSTYRVYPQDRYSIDGNLFRCFISNHIGSSTSNSAMLNVEKFISPYIYLHPQPQTKTSSSPSPQAEFSIKATGTPPLAYQWQVSVDEKKTWNNIPGAVSESYTILPGSPYYQDGFIFRCLVNNNAGQAISRSAKLNYFMKELPVISSHPSHRLLSANTPASFSVSASGTDPLHYKWQASFDNGDTWQDVHLAHQNSFTVYPGDPYFMDRMLFRCIVSNYHGQTISNSVWLSDSLSDIISITSNPEDHYIDSFQIHSPRTFSISASGPGALDYQWQVSTDNGDTWADIISAQQTSLTLSPSAPEYRIGNLFRCRVSNSSEEIFSNAASLKHKN